MNRLDGVSPRPGRPAINRLRCLSPARWLPAACLTLLLTALLFAGPAALRAEAAFHLSGSWRTTVDVAKPKDAWNLDSRSLVSGSMRFVPDDRPHVLAVVNISGTGSSQSLAKGDPLAIAPERVGVTEAYIQVASTLLADQEWLFRFGSQNSRRAGFLSETFESDGVTVSNINIFNRLNGQLFYLWGSEPGVALMGAQAVGYLGSGTVALGFAQRDGVREAGAEIHMPLPGGRMAARFGASYAFSRLHRVHTGVTAMLAPGWKVDYQYMYTDLLRPFSVGYSPPMPTNVHVLQLDTTLFDHAVQVQAQTQQNDLFGTVLSTQLKAERSLYLGKRLYGFELSVKQFHNAPLGEFGLRTNVDFLGLKRVALRGAVEYASAAAVGGAGPGGRGGGPGGAGGGPAIAWSVHASHVSSQGLSLAAGYHSKNGPRLSLGVTVGF